MCQIKSLSEIEHYRGMNVKTTSHCINRLVKRFGLGKKASQRYAEKIVKEGDIVKSESENIKIVYKGNTYIYAEVIDYEAKHPILLMITACNECKASEWNVYVKGKKRTANTTKGKIRNELNFKK
jgi:hypothetical protein